MLLFLFKLFVSFILAAIGIGYDIYGEPNIAIGIIYIPFVIFAMWYEKPYVITLHVVGAISLIFIGYLVSDHGCPLCLNAANRVFASIILITMGVLLYQRRTGRNILSEYNRKLEYELTYARRMQLSLLPTEEEKQAIMDAYDMVVKSFYRPSIQIGGDLWGFVPVSATELGVYVLDCSGKGVTAALDAFRVHTLIQENIKNATDPAKFMQKLNFRLTSLLPHYRFVTMFYGVIDTANNTIKYSSAAHTDSLFFRNNEKGYIVLDGRGFVLGLSENSEYENHQLTFEKKDMIVLYSDGFVEGKDSSGNYVKEEAFFELVERYRKILESPNPELFEKTIVNNDQGFLLNPDDDLTFVSLSRK